MAALRLPAELWLRVFTYLPWTDKLRMRCTCSRFRSLLDESSALWRGFSVLLQDPSRYNRGFWRSLARWRVRAVRLRAGARTDLQLLDSRLPLLDSLRLDRWTEREVRELRVLGRLQRLSITSGCAPLGELDFLVPLSDQLTQLTLCNVQLTCPAAHLMAAVTRLRRLTSLQLHHDGSLRIRTLGGILGHLNLLTHLSWTMIAYKALPQDFFGSAHLPDGAAAPQLSHLQLLNYDAAVTRDVLQPLSRLRSLSVLHLYSVPGPTCHLQTWLTSLPELSSLSVHGGHPLAAYAAVLPPSLLSLTLSVDLQPEDLQVVSARAPGLEHLHLEPWGSSSSLIKLLPHLFPHLRRLAIRHHGVSGEDFLLLQELKHLHTVEILDAYHRPNPEEPSWVLYEPSPHLLQLTCKLQELTNHRVQTSRSPSQTVSWSGERLPKPTTPVPTAMLCCFMAACRTEPTDEFQPPANSSPGGSDRFPPDLQDPRDSALGSTPKQS
ncbi:hypothetical protein OJAV_G00235050 [Oryzias javanicus]|uniref:F-box domain-containing protein n=1 Tax=Oryzias javanicus TaxID=123683 RepID=A0A437BYL5_ORYJA|nr:hypothetical protein OJAV_G00235050 [Oryzias javanicus]